MMNNMEKQFTDRYRLVVLGMGYVGLTLAGVYARSGFSVLGVDVNQSIVDMLKRGQPHFHERGLPELLEETKDALKFSTQMEPDTKNSIFVIAVGTSLNKDGTPDYSQIDQSVKDIAAVLKKGDIIILRSTVVVGTTRMRVTPILEALTGLTVGTDIFVGFAPERTVEGRAIEELKTLPQVVSASSLPGLESITRFFKHVSDEVVAVDTLEAAEMVKLVSNSYRDLTFAFANAVALAAAEHNVDVLKLIAAANYGYERNRIPLPSPGVGGYCLTKDPYLFAESSPGAPSLRELVHAGRVINNLMPAHVVKTIEKFCVQTGVTRPKVLIAGLAFKGEPATSDIRFSPSIEVIKLLAPVAGDIYAYDPHVAESVMRDLGTKPLQSLKDAATLADVIVFMHGSTHYLDEEVITTLLARDGVQMVFDTWGIFKEYGLPEKDGIVYANLSYLSN
jgi:UDP-N-acetyl-D-mannosaminuronic acid dehydrogenase